MAESIEVPATAKAATRPESLTERAYTYLKDEIISGRIAPGTLLDGGQIAREMGVSKTPVREAVLRLEQEGALEVTARRGIRVLPLNADDLQAIYQVITALEVEAVHLLALKNPSKAELSPLFEQIVRMRVAAEAEDGEAWNRADEAFHRSLFDMCGNARLREVGHLYRDKSQRAHFVALRLVPIEQKARSVEAHSEILTFLTSGDANAARSLHRKQRQRGGALLLESIRAMRLDHL